MARLRQIDDEVLERPFDKTQFLRLLRYMGPYKKQMGIAFALMIVAALCSMGQPFIMSRVIGDVLQNRRSDQLALMIGCMVLLAGTIALCVRQRVRLMERSGRRAIATLRQELFDHIQTLSFSFFDTRSAGKILVRVINDVNSLNDLFTNGIINVLIDCLSVILLLSAMLVINWKLTLISMAILPLLLMIVFRLKRVMRKRWQMVRIKISNMNGYLHESLAGMRVTEAFVRERENDGIFTDVNHDIRNSWLKAVGLNNLFWPSMDITSAIGTILVYIAGVNMLRAGTLELANLLLILWYLGRVWEPLNNLSNFYNMLLTAMASMERIFEIFDTGADILDKGDEPPLPQIQGRVTFEHVTFGYDTDKTVLRDVSFDVEPGQTIALVGPTGAGKSTVVNLISRFYEASRGRVLIDGHCVREVTLQSLRTQMGVMMQDSFIFSGTIMENIRYGRLNATDEEVVDAAKAVSAHEFIMRMDKGYMTEVNERGSSLSMGQRQLISFARALLNDPRILILDEATSSIDTHTELLIQKALAVLLKGRTSFVIAHRLSTIRGADRIMVIEDGVIAESGTHDELMRTQGGHYKALCEAQYRFLDD